MFTRAPLAWDVVLTTVTHHFPSEPATRTIEPQSQRALAPPLTNGTASGKSHNLSEPPLSHQ